MKILEDHGYVIAVEGGEPLDTVAKPGGCARAAIQERQTRK
jgi:hypothetical protein